MALELAHVTPNLFLQMLKSDVERTTSVLILAFSLQDNARIEMGGAIGAIKSPFMRKDDVRIGTSVEIFSDCRFETCTHLLGQRLADLDLLA